jgi:hypothetical protein
MLRYAACSSCLLVAELLLCTSRRQNTVYGSEGESCLLTIIAALNYITNSGVPTTTTKKPVNAGFCAYRHRILATVNNEI